MTAHDSPQLATAPAGLIEAPAGRRADPKRPGLRALVLAAIVVLAGVVSGQQVSKDVPPPAVERSYEAGHCKDYEAKMLQLATNYDDPNQEGYLRSAEAYSKLDAIGQGCN